MNIELIKFMVEDLKVLNSAVKRLYDEDSCFDSPNYDTYAIVRDRYFEIAFELTSNLIALNIDDLDIICDYDVRVLFLDILNRVHLSTEYLNKQMYNLSFNQTLYSHYAKKWNKDVKLLASLICDEDIKFGIK